jgi:hypothetical protein
VGVVLCIVVGTVPVSALAVDQEAKLLAASGGIMDRFGYSVAVDGDTAVIGAVLDETTYIDTGAAYVFTRTGSAWVEEDKFAPCDGTPKDRFGGSVAVDDGAAVIGA